MKDDLFVRKRVAQRRKIDIRQWIDNEITARNSDLKQTKLFAVAVKTVGFRIERDSLNWLKLGKQLLQLRSVRDHFNPLSSNSALVFVAFKLSINFSIASIGGSAAIALRKS